VSSWRLQNLDGRVQTVDHVAMTIFSGASVVIDTAGCGTVTADLLDGQGLTVVRPRAEPLRPCTQSRETDTLALVAWPEVLSFLTSTEGLNLSTKNLREQLTVTSGEASAEWMNQGSRANLYLSKRRPETLVPSAIVPDVLGVEPNEAEQRILDAGLPVVSFMTSPIAMCEKPLQSECPPISDRVLAISPAIGEPVPQGQTVVLLTQIAVFPLSGNS